MERVNETLLKSFFLGKPVSKLRYMYAYFKVIFFSLKDQHILFFQNEIELS